MYPLRFSFDKNPPPPPNPYKNILFGSGEQDDPYQTDEPQPTPAPQFMDAYAELMKHQNGPAMSAYSKFVQQGPPQERDYKPGKVTRLGAILSGAAAGYRDPASGVETATNIIKRPYREAVARNQLQGSYLQEGAKLEDTSYQRQLQTMNQMRLAENQRIDNERQERQLQNTISKNNLDMQKTLLEIARYGKSTHLDKNTGILYLVDELNPGKRTALGKYDQSSGERIGEATTKAQNASNIVEGRQSRLQKAQFGHQDTMQQRGFTHAENMAHTSINQVITKNAANVDALVATNPAKYKPVYRFNTHSQQYEITNPLETKGFPRDEKGNVDYSKLTPQEIDDYNAFVEIHNANIKGVADDKMLEPISKYQPVVKKQSSVVSPYRNPYTA